jgi:hypothetical protein
MKVALSGVIALRQQVNEFAGNDGLILYSPS